ncbi:hypothetical protein ABT330_06745 [Streptomyces sp. NPDC000658]|uniref:hypothetical protein n=1 Tax=Streptomyces sp. NPDC000658 TaxID=3154266 RepID=UPI00331F4CD1
MPTPVEESERPLWFTGQLVGAEDLGQWNTWALARKRRHNRLLHGWGLVFGADVRTAQTQNTPIPATVDISPGFVLSPQGDEIAIDDPLRVDVRTLGPVGPLDPAHLFFLAVRYDESPGGAAGQTRTTEGFSLGLLDTLPEIYTAPDPQPVPGERPAPPHTSEPWVVLAGVRIPAAGGVELDLSVRRFVPQLRQEGPVSQAQPADLTLTPNLTWMNDDFARAWTHEDGCAVTRASDVFSSPPPGGDVTSSGIMNVVLPQDSLISEFRASGTRAPDRNLTITLSCKEIALNGGDGSTTPIAVLRVPKDPHQAFFDVTATAEPDRAQVDNTRFRYYIVAEAVKTTDTGQALTGKAVINDFRIVHTP